MEPVPCPLCGGARDREVLIARRRRMVRCESCGVIFRNPRPPLSSYVEEFTSGRAEVGDEAWLGERRTATFLRFLDAWPGRPGRVLDVGCGGGWFLKAATERGWSAVGVDLSPKAVRHAHEVFGLDARQGRLDEQKLERDSFDLVTLWNVLDVSLDPLGLLRTVRPLLRPGGMLYLRTPNYPFQRAAFAATCAVRTLGLGGAIDRRPDLAFVFNVTAFSRRTIGLCLTRAGFEAVRVIPSPPSAGDPYRVFGGVREWPLSAIKVAAHGVARLVWVASGGRSIVSASLEASARRP